LFGLVSEAAIAILKFLLLDKWHLHEKLQRVLRKVLRDKLRFLGSSQNNFTII
jgi:hypothetical protein